jgi:transcription antitermination factor NusG
LTFIAVTADHAKARKVRRRLRQKGCEAYLPAIVQHRAIIKSAKVKHRRVVTLLMTYILVKAPDHPAMFDLWLRDILETKGVRGYVDIGGDVAMIPDSGIITIKATVADMVKAIKDAKRKSKRWFRAGEKARFKEGLLAGRAGTIQWVDHNRIGIEALIFGSMRTILVEKKNLEAA